MKYLGPTEKGTLGSCGACMTRVKQTKKMAAKN